MITIDQLRKHAIVTHNNWPEGEFIVAVSISKEVFHYFRGAPDSLKYDYTYSRRTKKRRRLKTKYQLSLINKLNDKETNS